MLLLFLQFASRLALKLLPRLFIQSEFKPKPIVTGSHHALCVTATCTYFSFADWFTGLAISFLIECVRLTSSNSQMKNKRATKGFILIRHKRYKIYTCLQLSSSIASFVWKPAHFELRSYGGAGHNTKIAFVEKYTLIS